MTNFNEVQCNEFGRKVYRDAALTLNCYICLMSCKEFKKKIVIDIQQAQCLSCGIKYPSFKAANNLASNILKKVYLRR